MSFVCQRYGCTAHPSQKGVVIYRISPKGEPFRGLCDKHIGDAADPVTKEICEAISGKRDPSS